MTCQPNRQNFDPAALDFGMFTRDDLVNLALQRSAALADVPNSGRLIRAWERDDHGPLEALIDERGQSIARRAARIIAAEFDSLIPVIDPLKPARIADIGCGYAIFDLFAYRRYGADLLLIDLEETEHRHFGFATEGAAYTSLATARRFLAANGVPDEKVTVWNPDKGNPPEAAPVDLAVSFLSCGFHFPVDMYLPFFRFAVRPGGAIVLDLRSGKAPQAVRQLRHLGALSTLSRGAGVRRVLVRKKGEK